jgi:hypothetical protein
MNQQDTGRHEARAKNRFSGRKVEVMKYMTNSGIGLILMLGLATLPASAQNQAQSNSQNSPAGSSLGDYARQVRKDPAAKSKPKVFDNDNLPKDDKLSIVGTAPAASTDNSAAKQGESSDNPATGEAKAGADAKSAGEAKSGADANATTALKGTTKPADDEAAKQAAWKQWGERINSQKQQVDLLTRELDVVQREYQIRAAAMYADAGNRLRNSADWDKQDAQYKQQIADKQKALDEAKQKLDDTREDARKAGVPSSVREE